MSCRCDAVDACLCAVHPVAMGVVFTWPRSVQPTMAHSQGTRHCDRAPARRLPHGACANPDTGSPTNRGRDDTKLLCCGDRTWRRAAGNRRGGYESHTAICVSCRTGTLRERAVQARGRGRSHCGVRRNRGTGASATGEERKRPEARWPRKPHAQWTGLTAGNSNTNQRQAERKTR